MVTMTAIQGFYSSGLGNVRRRAQFDVNDAAARDLEKRGLAVKMQAPPRNKMALDHQGKSPAGGEEQPSSVSPPARASRRPIAKASAAGRKRKKKRGA